MATIHEIKARRVTETPVLLFECTLKDGTVERWSTHAVTLGVDHYNSVVLEHSVFDMRWSAEELGEGPAKVSVTLANLDSHFSEVERMIGFKGARVKVRFGFADVSSMNVVSDVETVFAGMSGCPDEVNFRSVRLTFQNRLSMQRIAVPEVRVQRQCPWHFPANGSERVAAMDGGTEGRYSPHYACGYSADVTGGRGSLENGNAFTACDKTPGSCKLRGMWDTDSLGRVTRRYGGLQFVPGTVRVRSYGERFSHLSDPLANEAKYNEAVPLVYGTAWYEPPVVFARNDGNLTHCEVLLGLGEMEGVLKVIVNDVEIPAAEFGRNMTASGWHQVVSDGGRDGRFNEAFVSGSGEPLGDPHGGLAVLAIAVPNRISEGRGLPKIKVLAKGRRIDVFTSAGDPNGTVYTNNPAWILLDLLRRGGWRLGELDIPSFAAAAAYCDEAIDVLDHLGRPAQIPRFQCNLALRKARSLGEVVRGVRNAALLLLRYDSQGRLQASPEGSVSTQQANKPACSNSSVQLNGGWPAFEFGDGTNGFSDLACRENGEPAIRLWSRSTADSPNRYALEFQDEWNGFQQDSLALVDSGDVALCGHEVSAGFPALGLPNFHQAARVLRVQLEKSIRGNLFIEFETGVRGIGLRPGDLVTVTYLKEGLDRQLFRIIRIQPGMNFARSVVTAQVHSDAWYGLQAGDTAGAGALGQPSGAVGLPRPLIGDIADEAGQRQFSVVEEADGLADGSQQVQLRTGFLVPTPPSLTQKALVLVSLIPTVDTTGGQLAGGRTYFYGLTGVDADGRETALSFLVKASVPAGVETATVRLNGLGFGPEIVSFHVYRGTNSLQLLRIASNEPLQNTFVDNGRPYLGIPAPDASFYAARIYWRRELLPPTQATSWGSASIGSAALAMVDDEYQGAVVRIQSGKGEGQERGIAGNSSIAIAVTRPWDIVPDASSAFTIAEGGWRLGAESPTAPARIVVPNRSGAVVQISGRATNILGDESAVEASPVTRWVTGGAAGPLADLDVADRPIFGLTTSGGGLLELSGVGFLNLANTRTVTSGTLTVHFRDELNKPEDIYLADQMSAEADTMRVSPQLLLGVGALIRIDREIVEVISVLAEDTFGVRRGRHGTTAVTQAAGAAIQILDRRSFVVAFPREFFGSPASGSFRYSIPLRCACASAADLFVTNSKGNSETTSVAFTATGARGLRTLSGGQISLQWEGFLSTSVEASPVVVNDTARSVRDVFATVTQAPVGGDVRVRVKRNAETYCELTVAAGDTNSNTVDGQSLPPLATGDAICMEILSTPLPGQGSPGKDLSVTIRL